MGSVGDAYDNALCEGFFATLECELLVLPLAFRFAGAGVSVTLSHVVLAAFRAMALRFISRDASPPSFPTRFPSLRPRATAAGFFRLRVFMEADEFYHARPVSHVGLDTARALSQS